MHSGTALKTEVLRAADVEDAFVALHVKLHSTVAGLREQFNNNNGELRKAPVSPLLVEFQRGLERLLSDTMYIKDQRVALAELRAADASVERLISPYKVWEASHRSYKLSTDSGILLEVAKTGASLKTRLSQMKKAFEAKTRSHAKRLKTLRILVSASATKSSKDALQREEKYFSKLSQRRPKQFAKISSAVDAIGNKDPELLFGFVRAVHDATVSKDLHAMAMQ
eukprot:CAMPEP_0172814216 /NCGR_PEP_ID=MMETSP1075-20121228/11118_1 /TAXON_ID=2916 /ORGANISM="Ceratium fusus, Strain PA161109" /LENGTH=224 /DNA_ID=CAMNT_0013654003 /DNA_START=106 /DNA_END=780 /DNA_ORIENTATION=+